MSHLYLKLFGSFEASLNGQPIKQFYSDKVRALLAYLVSSADQPHHRTVSRQYLLQGFDLAMSIEAVPIVLGGITSIAALLATLSEVSKAFQLIGFLREQPAVYDYYLDAMEHLQRKLTTSENVDQTEMWLRTGRSLSLEVVRTYLVDLNTNLPV